MLPSNIDLTAHFDFGGNRVNPWIIAEVRGGVRMLPESGRPLMTSDEYDRLCMYESLFGKRHYDDHQIAVKKILFDTHSSTNDWFPFVKKSNTFPWNSRTYNYNISYNNMFQRIPWKIEEDTIHPINHPINDDKGHNLFNSR